MAQSGFTPISLYFSATGAAVPTAANLVAGELALNTNDGKLYFKNSAGVVTLLAGSTSGPAGGSNTQVQYNNSGVLAGITGATTNGTALTLVAPNLGSPFSVGTMPAFTLGGTVSGGGNQINNVVIGTTTPLAGAFTTVTTSGAISEVIASGNAQASLSLMDLNARQVVLRSPDPLGTQAQVGTITNHDLELLRGGTVRGLVTSTGFSVTGTLSATGTLSGGTSGTAYSFSGSAPAGSLTLNSSGNLGLGVTPSAWGAGTSGIDLNTGGSAGALASSGTLSIANNGFFNGTNWIYKNTSSALMYQLISSEHRWSNAVSGTAGNAISFTQAMTLDASGNLGIGTTSFSARLTANLDNSTAYANTAPNIANCTAAFTNASGHTAGGTFVGYQLNISGNSQNRLGYIGAITDSTSNQALSLVFGTNTAGGDRSEKMRLDSSGNLGIGTSSPAAKLDIAVASASVDGTKGVRIANPGGTIVVFECGVSGDSFIGTTSGSDFSIRTSNTVATTFSNVGIVTMPAYGAGAATFSAAGVISSVSDETWKIKDGVPVDTDAMLKKLEPGYWYYNDEKKETFGADRQLGFYAQNVNAAIGPEAAPTPEEGKPWGYYDRSVLAITVMSLQKALATIETLTARITALETA